jgi:FkbM family methyltransferase
MVHVVATALAHGRPLALEPGWQRRVVGDDKRWLTQLRHEIWAHYRDNDIDTPVVFRWYDGLRLRLFLGNHLSLCLYVLGSFEPNEFVLLRTVLRPGMVVLDGGANEGLFSLYAARLVHPSGTVIAVEPSARELARLQANAELNHVDGVKLLKLALGSHVGEASLAVAESRYGGMNAIGDQISSVSPRVRTHSRENVRMETIDVLVDRLELSRLDFIKLDVEGSEVDALEGARASIIRFRPTILLEAETERLASQARSKRDLVELLADLGYELWVFDAESAQLRRAVLPAEPEGNAVAAPRGWRPPTLAPSSEGSGVIRPPARPIGVDSAPVPAGRFEVMHRLVASSPFDLPIENWPELYDLTVTFRPDLVLELGRGYGNSTCVFTEAANAIGECRVVSVDSNPDRFWQAETAPKLLPLVGTEWFARLTVLQDDITTIDFQPLLQGSARVLVFWDAHGAEIADAVLRRLLPALPQENLLVVDDVWHSQELYGLHAEYKAGPLWSLFDELVPLWEYLHEGKLEFEAGERWISFTAPRSPKEGL